METQRPAGYLLITPLGLTLLGVFVAPLLMMIPTSLRHYDAGKGVAAGWTLENYTQVVTDPYFHGVLARTFSLGALVTLICLLLGYPLAYVLARTSGPARSWLTLLIVFPLLLNLVVRSFGWIALLANHGLYQVSLIRTCAPSRASRLR